jgi:hypothetical protein
MTGRRRRKMRKYDLSLLLVFCVLFLGPLISGQEEARQAEEPASPLLRIDLLQTLNRELKPPTRNIFSSEKAATGISQSNISVTDPSGQTGGREDFSLTEGGTEAGGGTAVSIILSYKGFVRAGDQFVALVLYGGMSMAVLKGDVIAEGVEIGTITIEEIQVIGPDSSVHKFPLEGDQE